MNNGRYTFDNFLGALNDPSKFVRECKRIAGRAASPVYKRSLRRKYGDEIDVMAEDWDNLLILDACRYDTFAERNRIDGELGPVLSKGSNSREFISRNFSDRELHDAVYVTANGHAERISEDVFYTIEKTYDSDTYGSHLGWPPDVVFDAAVEAHERYQSKRLVFHFMQPHAPYLGDYANGLRERVTRTLGERFYLMDNLKAGEVSREGEGDKLKHLLDAASRGYVTNEELKRAYVENLELALDYVDELIERLDGKTVVTSDHGELLGGVRNDFYAFTHERYGHGFGIYNPELRVVPWLEVPSDDRREIVAEEPIGVADPDRSDIEDNLEALGYL